MSCCKRLLPAGTAASHMAALATVGGSGLMNTAEGFLMMNGCSSDKSDHVQTVDRVMCIIDELQLDLRGLVVGTEAATGPFAWTAAIAAAAGATEVRIVARTNAYGTAPRAIEETLAAVTAVTAKKVVRVSSITDARKGDVVTNLGPLRPFDEAAVAGMRPGSALPLMWETWEWRSLELDLRACVKQRVLVLGTDESHPAVRTMSYVGMIPVKLLLGAGEPVTGQRVALVGAGRFVRHMAMALEGVGARVRQYDDPRDLGNWTPEAVVFADHESPDLLVGNGGRLEVADFSARIGRALVVHVSGFVDAQAIRTAGLRMVPDRIAQEAHRMSVTTGYIGIEPVLRLHAAGLAVGAALARAWQVTGAYDESLRLALQAPIAQNFSVAQWHTAGKTFHVPSQSPEIRDAHYNPPF